MMTLLNNLVRNQWGIKSLQPHALNSLWANCDQLSSLEAPITRWEQAIVGELISIEEVWTGDGKKFPQRQH